MPIANDGYGVPEASWQGHQTITNEAFPPDVRSIPNQADEIDVWVRVVWERDGQMWHMGSATRWTDRVVFVEFDDPRRATIGVWVAPGDVRRPLGPIRA